MIEIPKQCPSCGSPIETIGPKMFCRSSDCPAQSFGKIKKFLKIVGVLGIGDGILKALINQYEIETQVDLVKVMLNDNIWKTDEMAEIKIGAASLGLSRATKIRDEFKNLSLGIPLSVFIDSLQIPFLGTSNSERVAEFCGSLDKFLSLNTNQLLSIDKIGHEMSEAIMAGIGQNKQVASDLVKLIPIKIKEKNIEEDVPKSPIVPPEKQVLGGASFCISGKLSQPKEYYYEIIENLGGEAHRSIKSDTTYLVLADKSSTSNKAQKAKKYGSTIIDEAELNTILGIT